MKQRFFTITAMAASLLMGTAMMASAQSDNQMNGQMKSGSDQMQSGGTMNSDSNGAMKSNGSMKSGDMKSGSSMNSDGSSMKSGSSMNSDSGMKNAVMVGGAPMYPSKTIVENASQAKNLTTLVKAVKAAGLVDTLSGKGPFTVFAPTNKAFGKLPEGTVSKLMEPSMKAKLKEILTYHVVPGKLTAADLKQKIKENGGPVNLTTVEGEVLTVRMDNGRLVLIDKKGGGADITTPDVMQSNGVVHVINAVLMP